jgi:pyrroline-5-carboxylate reductase
MTQKIGFLGVGYLAESMIRGLASKGRTEDAVLSPRSAERSARLSEEFGCLQAVSNQEVVELCDVIIIATLPDQVVPTLEGLVWRQDQKVISVAAGVPLSTMNSAAAPATAFRSMPVTSSALGESMTAMVPQDEVVRDVLGNFGEVVGFEDEQTFESASGLGAFYGLVFAMIGEISRWTEGQGVAPEQARVLTAGMVKGAASVALSRPDCGADQILADLMTPNGITEAGLDHLKSNNGLAVWSDAMNAALRRLENLGKP